GGDGSHQHVGARAFDHLILRLCAQAGGCREVFGAAEIREELGCRNAGADAVVEDRVIQRARGNAAARVSADAGETAGELRSKSRLHLVRHLMRRRSGVLRRRNRRIARERSFSASASVRWRGWAAKTGTANSAIR